MIKLHDCVFCGDDCSHKQGRIFVDGKVFCSEQHRDYHQYELDRAKRIQEANNANTTTN